MIVDNILLEMSFLTQLLLGFLLLFVVDPSSESSMYSYKTEICCDGTVHPRKSYERCCGSETYYNTLAFCCNGKQIVEKFNLWNKAFDCCPDPSDPTKVTIFNQRFKICCKGKLLPKPVSYKVYGCCGQQIYDAYAQICCHGAIHEFEFDARCCGQELVSKKNSQVCCGGSMFIDPKTELCCAVLSDQPDPEGDPEMKHYHTAVHPIEPGSKKKCCGLEAYDPDQYICCPKQPTNPAALPYMLKLPAGTKSSQLTSCCFDDVIVDVTKELCCDGEVVKKTTPTTQCCNEKIVYDANTSVCCGRKVLAKVAGMYCCPGTSSLYSTKDEQCCGDRLFPLNPKESSRENPLVCCKPNNY